MRWPSPASAISMCSPAILCTNSSSSSPARGRVGLGGDVGNQNSREAARGGSCCCCPSQGASVLPWPLAGEAVLRLTFRTAGDTLCSRRSTGSWRPYAACKDKRRRQRGSYAGMQRWRTRGGSCSRTQVHGLASRNARADASHAPLTCTRSRSAPIAPSGCSRSPQSAPCAQSRWW